MSDVIRLFVGASPAQRVPYLVLKRSIESRAFRPVYVQALCDLGVTHALPKDPANRPRTPFSFQRFAIPSLCEYKGRAIYLDSDMIVLDDVVKLWDLKMLGAAVLATDVEASARNAVMLIDCERVAWDLREIVNRLDDGETDYRGIMDDLAGLGPVHRTIPPRWNRLDEYVEGGTSLLHFTDMRRQPWRYAGHPLEALWLEEAVPVLLETKEGVNALMDAVLFGTIRLDIHAALRACGRKV